MESASRLLHCARYPMCFGYSRFRSPMSLAPACNVNHKNKYVSCQAGVIDEIPLSCGRKYAGQIEQCLNDRLRQPNNNVRSGSEGYLAIHCRDCQCSPDFHACSVVARNHDKRVRWIIEAKRIIEAGDKCVSVASISLSPKELLYLKCDCALMISDSTWCIYTAVLS